METKIIYDSSIDQNLIKELKVSVVLDNMKDDFRREFLYLTIVNYRELINSNYKFFDKSRMCSFLRILLDFASSIFDLNHLGAPR